MRLTVLGSSGSAPHAGNPSSGYLVEHDDTKLVVDMGFGVFAALLDRVDPRDIDAVIVSHGHADHCADLLAAGHWCAYGPGQGASIRMVAPDGVSERFAGFTNDGDPEHRLSRAMAFEPAGGDLRFGDVRVRFWPANHSVPAVVTRIEAAGFSLTYTGDTGPSGPVARFAAGTDLLLAEATWQGNGDPSWPFHLTARQAGEMARAAGAEALMLTHIRPDLDPAISIAEAEAAYGRLPMVATPGVTITID
jgi:ribonuclease BN (tRNA processing enzyme)